MSKCTASTDIDKVSDKDVSRYTEIALEELQRIVNGDLEFGANIKANIVNVNFTSANTQQAIGHGLGKVPSGYLMISSNAATQVYNGESGSSSSTIYLKSTQPAVVGLMFF